MTISNLTIDDLMYWFIDGGYQSIKIYDLKSEQYIYTGRYDDCPDEFKWLEISSIDNLEYFPNETGTIYLTFNVEMEL